MTKNALKRNEIRYISRLGLLQLRYDPVVRESTQGCPLKTTIILMADTAATESNHSSQILGQIAHSTSIPRKQKSTKQNPQSSPPGFHHLRFMKHRTTSNDIVGALWTLHTPWEGCVVTRAPACSPCRRAASRFPAFECWAPPALVSSPKKNSKGTQELYIYIYKRDYTCNRWIVGLVGVRRMQA